MSKKGTKLKKVFFHHLYKKKMLKYAVEDNKPIVIESREENRLEKENIIVISYVGSSAGSNRLFND